VLIIISIHLSGNIGHLGYIGLQRFCWRPYCVPHLHLSFLFLSYFLCLQFRRTLCLVVLTSVRKRVSHFHMTFRLFQYSPVSRKVTVRRLITLLLIVKQVFPLRANQISSIGLTNRTMRHDSLKTALDVQLTFQRQPANTHTHSYTNTHKNPRANGGRHSN
jgi:hypothetical protein